MGAQINVTDPDFVKYGIPNYRSQKRQVARYLIAHEGEIVRVRDLADHLLLDNGSAWQSVRTLLNGPYSGASPEYAGHLDAMPGLKLIGETNGFDTLVVWTRPEPVPEPLQAVDSDEALSAIRQALIEVIDNQMAGNTLGKQAAASVVAQGQRYEAIIQGLTTQTAEITKLRQAIAAQTEVLKAGFNGQAATLKEIKEFLK